MEELICTRFFFSRWPVVQAIFLGLRMHFLLPFVLHDFFDCKGLAGVFYSNSSTPLKGQMVHPLPPQFVSPIYWGFFYVFR